MDKAAEMTSPASEIIDLTGNPFVDTGLAVIAVLGGLADVRDLSLDDVRRVHADGSQLSSWNSRLKSFSQVLGTNNPLFQTGYGYKKGRGPSPVNRAIYCATLKNFLEDFGGRSGNARCEACGTLTDLNFAQACKRAVKDNGGNAPEDKWAGRDWFPLAGSLGSDAQALPAASRPGRLCGKCLFAVHYLPLGLMLIDGRLAVFQSTAADFWWELVRDIVLEVQSRVGLGSYGTLGAKEGTRAVTGRILGLFERLQTEKRFSGIPEATALEVWRFSNSNPPECDTTEIPNAALKFLWEAVGHGLRRELETLLASEKKQRPFLECVLEQREYGGLYPRGKWKGASLKLFALYQVRVCGRTPRVLELAHALASQRATELDKKNLDRLKREEGFSEASVRNQFRGMIARMALEGTFTIEDYLGLFPMREEESGIRVSFDGWNLIRYYLHYLDGFERPEAQTRQALQESPKLALVRYYASCIMRDYVRERGKDKFRSDLLSRIALGNVGLPWLRRQFVRLAETLPGFTYGAWKTLCLDANAIGFGSELLFQFRLLWGTWLHKDVLAESSVPVYLDSSDLPDEVTLGLRERFAQYVERRGLKRFHSDVLLRLRRGEISLDWFKRQLVSERNGPDEPCTLPEDQWDDLLRDAEGRPCSRERFFQMHLVLANLYREANNPKEEELL